MASHVLGESILSQKLAHEIGQVKLEDLGFVDETGSNLAMTRRYASARTGSRAYNHAPYGRGQNLTIIGAMALRGLVGEITFRVRN